MLSEPFPKDSPSEGEGVIIMDKEKWKAEWDKKKHRWVAHMLELTYPEPMKLDKTILKEEIGNKDWDDLPDDVKNWFIASVHCIG